MEKTFKSNRRKIRDFTPNKIAARLWHIMINIAEKITIIHLQSIVRNQVPTFSPTLVINDSSRSSISTISDTRLLFLVKSTDSKTKGRLLSKSMTVYSQRLHKGLTLRLSEGHRSPHGGSDVSGLVPFLSWSSDWPRQIT